MRSNLALAFAAITLAVVLAGYLEGVEAGCPYKDKNKKAQVRVETRRKGPKYQSGTHHKKANPEEEIPYETEIYGVCPAPPPGSESPCRPNGKGKKEPYSCLSDDECPDGELCCVVGCGGARKCVQAEPVAAGEDPYEYVDQPDDSYATAEHEIVYEPATYGTSGQPKCEDYNPCASGHKCVEYLTACHKRCGKKSYPCPIARVCVPNHFYDQCANKACPKGESCKLVENKCNGPPCYPQAKCVRVRQRGKKRPCHRSRKY